MPKKSGYLGRGVDQETAEMQNKHNHFTLGFVIFVVGGSAVQENVFNKIEFFWTPSLY